MIVTNFIASRLIASVAHRPPDMTIYRRTTEEYIRRWYLVPRNRYFSVYLHQALLDDDEPPHDHPWMNMSYILRGGYYETQFSPLQDSRGRWHLPGVVRFRGPGSVVFRSATTIHRLVVETTERKESWSLFITGPVVRDWGFWGVRGWVSHKLILDIIYGDGGSSKFNPEKAKHWLYDSDFTSSPAKKGR